MIRKILKNKLISFLIYFLTICLILTNPYLQKIIFTQENSIENTYSKIPKIAVLNFENLSKIKDETFAKKITDSIVIELVESKEYEVIEREALHKIFDELKLSTSGFIEPSSAKEIGKILGVEKIITGKINYIEILNKPTQAQIEITIRVIEVETGKISYAGIIKGISGEKPGYKGSEESLIGEAISSAAKEFIARFTGKSVAQESEIERDQPQIRKRKKSMLSIILVAVVGLAAAFYKPSKEEKGDATGTIRVKPTIPAGAKIFVDNEQTGKITDSNNDVDISNIKAGQRTVKLKLDGYEDYEQQVNVEAGGIVTVEGKDGLAIVLEPSPATGGPFNLPWKK